MKKIATTAVAVAMLTTVAGSQVWALGNINTSFDNSRRYDQSQRTGRDSMQNSHNSSSSSYSSVVNRNDNRQDNRQDNRRFQSHNLGDNSIMINGGYQPRVGHDSLKYGAISGSNNSIDNSVSGNFGVGHTTMK